jgi:hypothetical protein
MLDYLIAGDALWQGRVIPGAGIGGFGGALGCPAALAGAGHRDSVRAYQGERVRTTGGSSGGKLLKRSIDNRLKAATIGS